MVSDVYMHAHTVLSFIDEALTVNVRKGRDVQPLGGVALPVVVSVVLPLISDGNAVVVVAAAVFFIVLLCCVSSLLILSQLRKS